MMPPCLLTIVLLFDMSATQKTTEILSLIQQNRLSPASARLKLWLKKEPDQPDAWHLMGVVQLRREDYAAAFEALQRALQLQPANPYVLNNRSVVLLRLGRVEDSIDSARQALALHQGDPGFWANLGYALQAKRDFPAMAKAFEQACHCAPEDPEFRLGWALALRQQGAYHKAMAQLDQVRQPDLGVWLERLVVSVLLDDQLAEQRAGEALVGHELAAADALAEAGCEQAALLWYQRHLAQHPDDASARYLAQALQGRVAQADNLRYVEGLYDEAAPRFEERLIGHLNYQGPHWLDGHSSALGNPSIIWDLGCGTGLAGPVMRRYWPGATLVGVDLSEAMLEQAGMKQCYNALHHASLTDFGIRDPLAAAHRQPDLVLLMDVLIYLPNATDWLTTLMETLPSGCRVVLTLEQGPHEQIHPQGRIQHDGETLRQALAPHTCVVDETAMLRLEKGQAVTGRWLVFSVA